MRLRRGTLLLLAVLAGCATVPPTPPPSRVAEAASYRTPEDAPRVLSNLQERFAREQLTPADLSTPDLTLYAGLLLADARYNDAETAYALLDDRNPGNPEVRWSLVLLAAARGDTAGEARRLEAFQRQWPDDARSLSMQAQAAWDAKKLDQAAALADRAITAAPADASVWSLRARIREDQGRYREAKQDLDRAVELEPENAWHWSDRGLLSLRHLRGFDDARADLEYSTLRNPGNVLAWAGLAQANEELNRPVEAWNAWKRALTLRPDYRFGYPSAAMLAFRYQEWEAAARFSNEAAKDYPGEYGFVFIEALSLRALGNPAAAQTVLQKARGRFEKGSTVDEMFRFLLTPGSDYSLNTAMNQEKEDVIRLRLRFYQGCAYVLMKSPRAAKAAFEEVGESTLKLPEIAAARDWLEHGL